MSRDSKARMIAATSEAVTHLNLCKKLFDVHYKKNSIYVERVPKEKQSKHTKKVQESWAMLLGMTDTLLAAYEATLNGLIGESDESESSD